MYHLDFTIFQCQTMNISAIIVLFASGNHLCKNLDLSASNATSAIIL